MLRFVFIVGSSYVFFFGGGTLGVVLPAAVVECCIAMKFCVLKL